MANIIQKNPDVILNLNGKNFPDISESSSKVDGKGVVEVEESPEVNGNTKNWRNLFGNVEKKMQMEFFEPSIVDGEILVEPPKEIADEGIKLWSGCLVGQFIRRKPLFSLVKQVLSMIWLKGIPQIHSLDNGIFIFRFDSDESRDWVLENGPWHLNGCPLVLTKWKPKMVTSDLSLEKFVPVWVKLYNIPPEYWTSKGLSYVASALGRPLFADKNTESKDVLTFARICIEIDSEKKVPDYFSFKMENKVIRIDVEYSWMPKKCSKCGKMGHYGEDCLSKKTVDADVGIKQVWIAKGSSAIVEGKSNENVVEICEEMVTEKVITRGVEKTVDESEDIGDEESVIKSKEGGINENQVSGNNLAENRKNKFSDYVCSDHSYMCNKDDEGTTEQRTPNGIVMENITTGILPDRGKKKILPSVKYRKNSKKARAAAKCSKKF